MTQRTRRGFELPAQNVVERAPEPPRVLEVVDRDGETHVISTAPASSYSDLRIHRELGNGAFGNVYLVVPESNPNTPYALKIIRYNGEEQHDCIRNEHTWVLKCRDRNPPPSHIVAPLDMYVGAAPPWVSATNLISVDGVGRRSVCILMELMDAGSLETVMLKAAAVSIPLTSDEIGAVLLQAVLGMRQLSDEHMTHRDLKPSNILVAKNGAVKIADFGCAGTVNPVTLLTGSSGYSSPEKCGALRYGLPSEIWALGCVVVALHTRQRVPFNNGALPTFAHTQENMAASEALVAAAAAARAGAVAASTSLAGSARRSLDTAGSVASLDPSVRPSLDASFPSGVVGESETPSASASLTLFITCEIAGLTPGFCVDVGIESRYC